MITIDICLSEIPESKRRKASNGKVYAKFVVSERKEKDKFDNDLTVYCSQTKEEREAKEKIVYVGAGKTITFAKKEVSASPVQVDNSINDLPFN